MKKVVGIFVCTLLLGSVLPVSGDANVEINSVPLSSGNTLYVGGSGPGNYSSIQDAVDDADEGDTIFVYDESSPYFETIIIDKSLNIIGENKDTTIIDGAKKGYVINISADEILLTGFTVKNSTKNHAGIRILSDNNIISDNIITDNSLMGIMIEFGEYNQIIDNVIFENEFDGIYVVGKYNGIRNNHISKTGNGIILEAAYFTNISSNIITENEFGIRLWGFDCNNIITRNNITNNDLSIEFDGPNTRNKVNENNFIGNDENALFRKTTLADIYAIIIVSIIMKDLYIIKNYRAFGRNTFDRNYWDGPRYLPYPIFGTKGYLAYIFERNNAVIFDWRPAQEPYEI